jgi:hypothetical protein
MGAFFYLLFSFEKAYMDIKISQIITNDKLWLVLEFKSYMQAVDLVILMVHYKTCHFTNCEIICEI